MRIQHNIMAMNAYRNYTNNTSALSKNLEKLSSGYKINRAGDDAAGLAISEKMRAQITGLDVAQKNAKDGISLVQTAEGALTEVHDMLNRMVELASQSANGTYDNEVDRDNLQKEMDQLLAEIDRIADSANFNGIKLLDGSMEIGADLTTNFTPDLPDVGSVLGQNTVLHQDAGTAASKTSFDVDLNNLEFTFATGDTVTIKVGSTTLATVTAASAATMTASAVASAVFASITDADASASGTQIAIGGKNFTVTDKGDGTLSFVQTDAVAASTDLVDGNMTVSVTGTGTMTGKDYNFATTNIVNGTLNGGERLGSTYIDLTEDMVLDGNTITLGSTTYTFTTTGASGTNMVDLSDLDANASDYMTQVAAKLTAAAASNALFSVGHDGARLSLVEKTGQATAFNLETIEDFEKAIQINGAKTASQGLTLQIGDTSDTFNQLTVSIEDMHADSLGIAGLDISTQVSAQGAINKIKTAINTVSSVRGTLGATQNRLDHTINNLSVMEENIQDAESTIRDTDVAEEMMAYTKNNILVQSAQAMLAQANQVPQGVLQLLQ